MTRHRRLQAKAIRCLSEVGEAQRPATSTSCMKSMAPLQEKNTAAFQEKEGSFAQKRWLPCMKKMARLHEKLGSVRLLTMQTLSTHLSGNQFRNTRTYPRGQKRQYHGTNKLINIYTILVNIENLMWPTSRYLSHWHKNTLADHRQHLSSGVLYYQTYCGHIGV